MRAVKSAGARETDVPGTAAAPSSKRDRLLFGAAFVPSLAILVLVLLLGVNVPYSDEWDWAPLFSDAAHGTLTFAELWRQHNEHRIIVPDLLALGLAAVGWNLIREEIASIVLCAASQAVLWQLIRRTFPQPSRPALFLAMAVVLWNAGQAENFAVGFQMAWFIVNACVVLVVWRLTSAAISVRDFLIAAVAATVACGSLEVGLLAWPVGFAAMAIARNASRTMLLIWAGCGTAVYAIYRIGFAPGSVGHVALAANIGGLFLYSLAYLGVPVAYWTGRWGCVLAGSLLAGLFVAFAVGDARRVRAQAVPWLERAPWYALGLFAILGAVATGPSRLGLGAMSVVTTTRYITVSLWLSIAVIALAAGRVRRVGSAERSASMGTRIIVAAIVCATTVSWTRGVRDWQHFSWARHSDLRALRSGNDAAVAPYYPHRDVLETDIRTIRALRGGPLAP